MKSATLCNVNPRQHEDTKKNLDSSVDKKNFERNDALERGLDIFIELLACELSVFLPSSLERRKASCHQQQLKGRWFSGWRFQSI